MNAVILFGYVGIGLLVFLCLFIILLYNRLIWLKNNVKNAYSQIDVQLKRRNDLLPKLIETVKGYMKHEKSVLTEITKARAAMLSASSTKEKAKASNQLTDTLKSLFAVSENYPQLKANENFMQLQEEISGTENKIAYSRQFYNDIVTAFNTKIQTFPNNIFARRLNFTEEVLFEATAEEKKDVKVDV